MYDNPRPRPVALFCTAGSFAVCELEDEQPALERKAKKFLEDQFADPLQKLETRKVQIENELARLPDHGALASVLSEELHHVNDTLNFYKNNIRDGSDPLANFLLPTVAVEVLDIVVNEFDRGTLASITQDKANALNNLRFDHAFAKGAFADHHSIKVLPRWKTRKP